CFHVHRAHSCPVHYLLVEDDVVLGAVVSRVLRDDGDAVDVERTLQGARRALNTGVYHLVVLDLGLPDGEGMTLCRELRDRGHPARVLVLPARDAVGDKVHALDGGADDYLTKPFDVAELMARCRALLRRPDHARAPRLRVDDIELDPAAHTVSRDSVL